MLNRAVTEIGYRPRRLSRQAGNRGLVGANPIAARQVESKPLENRWWNVAAYVRTLESLG